MLDLHAKQKPIKIPIFSTDQRLRSSNPIKTQKKASVFTISQKLGQEEAQRPHQHLKNPKNHQNRIQKINRQKLHELISLTHELNIYLKFLWYEIPSKETTNETLTVEFVSNLSRDREQAQLRGLTQIWSRERGERKALEPFFFFYSTAWREEREIPGKDFWESP